MVDEYFSTSDIMTSFQGFYNQCVNDYNYPYYFFYITPSGNRTNYQMYCGDTTSDINSPVFKLDHTNSFIINRDMTSTSFKINSTHKFKQGSFSPWAYQGDGLLFSNVPGQKLVDVFATTKTSVSVDTGSSGGGETSDSSNSPLTLNEFYIVPLMLGVLILMLFFKWCFPNKGGRRI